MANLLDIVDPNNLSTVLLELNGVEGGDPTGFLLRAIDLGAVETDPGFLQAPGVPGAVQVAAHHGPVETTMTLAAQHTSFDNLRGLIGDLAEQLSNGGVMRYQFDGQASPLYFEFFSSPLVQLIRGEDLTYKQIVARFRDPEGVPVRLWRQPYVFSATRTLVAGTAVTNTGLTLACNGVLGDMPALVKLTMTAGAAGAEVVQARVGRRSTGDLTEFPNHVETPISGASGVGTAWTEIFRTVIDPTASDSLEGSYRVFAAAQLLAQDEYYLQLRWGQVDQRPEGNTNPVVYLDATDASLMLNPADIALGHVRFDPSGERLVLSIWARAVGGGNITWGDLYLLPTTEMAATYCSPGFRFGRYGRLTYDGPELVLSGGADIDDDDRVRLNDVDEYGETPAETLAPGIYHASITCVLRNLERTREQLGRFALITGGGSGTETDSTKLSSRKGRNHTHYGGANPKTLGWRVTSSGTYRLRGIMTTNNDPPGRRRIKITQIRRSFYPTVGDGRAMVVDGITRDAYISNGGARQFPLHVAGPFMELEPGNNVLVFRWSEGSPRGIYREVDAREHLGEYISSRSVTVTVEVQERYVV